MSTQDIVETFIEQQRSQGRNEGRNEGRTEGLVEAARELLLDLLTERFGLPPEAISAVVAHTDDRELLRDWHRLAARAPAEEVFLAIRRTNGR